MFENPKFYDVIVVGAGHAGVEAALASARLGCDTLLLTMNPDTIAQMSCNPAIGGQAKGQLVREIDALGGEMGKNADMTGLQFRMLNRSKGPAVWAPRAQCDKKAYQFRMKWICERQPNLVIKQAQVLRILHDRGGVSGVETYNNVRFRSLAVVVTTGTFLRGLMHVGRNQQAGGRAGEVASTGLSASLTEIGLRIGRLKTGTPPRLLRRQIDFSKAEEQAGDEPVPYFTNWTDELFHVEQKGSAHCDKRYPSGSILDRLGKQLPCYITYTTPATAELIRRNLDKSPMYSGVIEGVGPRYCPSIEDKIVKFPSRERHQIFLEPEGMSTDEIYVNGFSTCLPYEIQVQLVATIVGCESAEIMRPAYAVEYDFCFPSQLNATLETKVCKNLFLAGQINGTSGYEEAAAQGLMAGINAARRVQQREGIVIGRDQGYIGVLIDDLVTKDAFEPYRMFTSRAEYRLLLRQDNADLRLSRLGHEVGLLSERNYRKVHEKQNAINKELSRLESTRSGSNSLADLLRRPEMSYSRLPERNVEIDPAVAEQVEIAVKYSGYIKHQIRQIEKMRNLEDKCIPLGFDYGTVPSLGTEAREKLSRFQPSTVGQAARISGVSPADISILLVSLKRQNSPQT